MEQKNLEAYGALIEVDQQERKIKEKQGYMKAYVMSVILPPIGLYYFFKYLFFSTGSKDDVKAGVIALALTVASILINIWSFAVLFGQMSPGGSGQSLDMLKKTATPENMKEIIKLYQ